MTKNTQHVNKYIVNLPKSILGFEDGWRFGSGFACGIAGVFTIATIIKAFTEWVTSL